MTRLSVLHVPPELGQIPSLTIIDAGSNLLRYNIHNWEFDWNWNFNRNLKYLNLVLSDFSRLSPLRVLGLMDVMTTFLPNIPEDSDERRVRTSQTEVNGMSYGIADTIGRNGYLTTLDLLARQQFLSKYLHDNYASVFTEQLAQLKKDQKGERRDGLNRQLHDKLYSQPSRKMSQVSASTTGPSGPDSSYLRQGASGIVLYVVGGRTLYVANVGHALALTELDEFVIIGNRGLWHRYARSEADPMIAAQKLRDFAISYGADGNTMIMRAGKKADIVDRTIALMGSNAGMPTAMRIHNNLLRRHLRTCGGDAFMCSFPTTLAAMWWCLIILECPKHGQLLARGLSVRMGVHCGIPVCEPDPITSRMDYFGPMVIRAARISGIALGGQIMCRPMSHGVLRVSANSGYRGDPANADSPCPCRGSEVEGAGDSGGGFPRLPSSPLRPSGLRCIWVASEHLYINSSPRAVSIAQVRDLAMLCLRIEALTSGRIFRPLEQKEHVSDLPLEPLSDEDVSEPTNAVACLALKKLSDKSSAIVTALEGHEGIDEQTLHLITSLLSRC
ncbi:hypothetical protein EDD22DRAFT_921905 [Suillus occidentalis]|nr:hypothetical protein EDD22DRAFT_921905 [Suillus occidentalis]